MEKLKETVFKLANSDPNNPLSPSQISFIEHQLLLSFPVLHTPSHPTYAAMIRNAIEGLNEENGSSEESISEYIKANYDDLPWAHNAYLSHHLSKLCKNGEIVCTSSTDKCYTTPSAALLQKCDSRTKPAKGSMCRKIKECVFKNEEEKNAGGVRRVRVGKNSSRRSLAVIEEDDGVGRGLAIVGEHNVTNNSQMMMDTQDDITTNAANMMLMPFNCVDESSLALTTHSESNIRDDAHELIVKESGLKESELMIVPYEGLTPISSERMYPMIVCGLAILPEPKKQECKYPSKRKVKARREIKEVSQEPILPLPALSVGSNLLEHDTLHKLLPQKAFETKVVGMESEMGLPWLMPMLMGNYFITCSHHADSKKSECNMFCLDCKGDAFCFNCLSLHNEDHRVVQIRKSSYRNAVRVEEIQRHLDISDIQIYIINSSKIVYLNARPQPQSSKATRVCEICCRSLLDSSRFCSLGCKFCATPMKFTNLKESQQACTSSMLKDGFTEQLEKQKNLDPSCTSRSEELMTVEDEEPLQKVLEKCGKRRKKDVVQNFTAKASLAIEASSEPATNLIVERTASLFCQIHNIESHEKHAVHKPTAEDPLETESSSEPGINSNVEETASMLCRIDKSKSHELESDGRIIHPEVDPSGFVVKGDVASDNLQSQQDKHQEQPTNESPLLEQSLQNPKHQIEGQERQSQIDVRLQDLEAPVATATFETGNVSTALERCEHETKQLKIKLRVRPQKQLEISKQDTINSSNGHLQQQEGLSNAATTQGLKQKKKQLKRDREGKPREEKGGINGVIIDSLNSQSQQQSKLKTIGRGRVRKQMEAAKEDAVALSGLLPKQQERLSEALIGQHSQLQIKQPKKDGRGRPRKQVDATKEDKPASSNLYLKSQDGSCELASSQHSLQQYKVIEKDLRRQRKQIEETKDDAETSSNLHLKLKEGFYKSETDLDSQQQTKKLKKDGRGRPRKQLEATNEEAAASSNLLIHQEERSELATNQHFQQQIKQQKKGGRGRPRKQIEVAKEDAAASSNLQIHQQAESSEPSTYQLSLLQGNVHKRGGQGRPKKGAKKEPAASMNLHLQEDNHLSKDGQGRPQEPEDLAAPSNLPYKLDEELSHQKKEHQVGDCPDTEPGNLQSEVHGTAKTRQEMPPPDDDTHHRLEKQKRESGDQLPEA